jgi:hypothetical protein
MEKTNGSHQSEGMMIRPSDHATDAKLAAGITAMRELRGVGHKTFENYLIVGDALMVGVKEALRKADTNKRGPGKYQREFRTWLTTHREFQERPLEKKPAMNALINIMENPEAVDWWRQQDARKLNNPESVWRAYKASPGQANKYTKPRPVSSQSAAIASSCIKPQLGRISGQFN